MLARLAAVVVLAAIGSSSHANCACGGCLGASTDDLQRVWEMAALQQRVYQQIEHPARVRELRSEIEFAEARLRLLRDRSREYEPMTRWLVGNPLYVTAEQTRLAILREERRLQTLRQVYAEEHRLHSYRLRANARAVSLAAQRLAHTHPPAGDGSIEIVNH
ncbi:MAG: hypothetical protein AAFV43_09110 [Planctomycetota bacterium]